jgi:hypothetical protein
MRLSVNSITSLPSELAGLTALRKYSSTREDCPFIRFESQIGAHFFLLPSTGTLEVNSAILTGFPAELVLAQDGFGLGT